jgi:hypothetical protein
LQVNSLVPIITIHTLWDMLQFPGGLWAADFGLLIPQGILLTLSMNLPYGSRYCVCSESGGRVRL